MNLGGQGASGSAERGHGDAAGSPRSSSSSSAARSSAPSPNGPDGARSLSGLPDGADGISVGSDAAGRFDVRCAGDASPSGAGTLAARSAHERDGGGRFAKGNRGGPGNPYAAHVGRWRRMLVECLSDDDLRAVLRALIDAAKAGEAWAIRELFDRTLGKPVEADLIARMEAIETALDRIEHDKPASDQFASREVCG